MSRTKRGKLGGIALRRHDLGSRKHPKSKDSKWEKQQATKAARTERNERIKRERGVLPYSIHDKILLVGEGDFSFAECLVLHWACTDVTATTFESEITLREKYEGIEAKLDAITESEQHVLFSVDATALEKSKFIREKAPFDRIIFNFPHVGGQSTDVNRQVRANQALISAFFTSSMPLLASTGSILTTCFEGEPYTLWNLRDLARSVGLGARTSWKFQSDLYPGYKHARTLGDVKQGGESGKKKSKTAWKGEKRDARTYEFMFKEAIPPPGPSKAKKLHETKKKREVVREADDSDEDMP